jgi:RNA-splicing ligase RtcB
LSCRDRGGQTQPRSTRSTTRKNTSDPLRVQARNWAYPEVRYLEGHDEIEVRDREFQRQMDGVWYDYRLSESLLGEAPAAYKDVKAVLRAQRNLVRVTRALRPVLNYKDV